MGNLAYFYGDGRGDYDRRAGDRRSYSDGYYSDRDRR